MSQDLQTQLDLTVMRDYNRYLHFVVAFLLLCLFGMGFMFVYQGAKQEKIIEHLLEVSKQRDEVMMENIQLKELNKPLQKKLDKGASYIHKKYGIPKDIAMRYARQFLVSSMKSGVDYSIGLAVASKESGFKYDAVSYTDCCYGIMQVHWKVWSKEIPGLTLKDLYDPLVNIDTGYEILKRYRNLSGDMNTALQRYYGSTVPEDNIAYAEDVLKRSQEIKRFLQS